MQTARKVVRLVRPYWARLLAGIVLSFLYSGTMGGIVWMSKWLLDSVLVRQEYLLLTWVALGVLGLFVLKGMISFGQTYLMKSAGMKLVRDMRNRAYRHILHLPTSYFSKESSGIILSRVMNDVDSLSSILSTVTRNFLVEVPTVIVLLGIAIYRRWDLTLMILFVFPLLGYGTRKLGKRIKKKRKEAQRKISFLMQRISESIQGAKVVKIFNREEAMAGKFNRENQQYYRDMMRVVRGKEFATLLTDVGTGVGLCIVIWYGGSMVASGEITIGDFASVILAINMVFSPVKKIGDAYTTLQESRASMERIDTLLEAPHEERGSVVIDGFREAISFRDVSFGYHDGAPVLTGVNLEIRPGDVVAVVGRSGVGKTTLVDLIPRFNRITSGSLTLDGVPINDIELRSLRELMGIVSQDIMLFNDTIRENIAFGRPGATDEEIARAAKLSYSDEFIQGLPDKYDTVIGERGIKLSGGQRQRIAIARAILKNPPILILDEATSSLDAVSEALVQKALEQLMAGRTTIIIAHRLSTVKNADRIVVFDQGRIAGIGRHEDLMAGNAAYMQLYNTFALSK